MTIKILPLPWIYTTKFFRKEVSRGYHKETDQVFNRNGIYLLNNKCWLEVDGKAYLYEKQQFLSELKTLNHKCLSDSERECLIKLIAHRMANQSQIDLLLDDCQVRMLRKLKLNAKISAHRLTKRIQSAIKAKQ